jgi:hypothetical protein
MKRLAIAISALLFSLSFARADVLFDWNFASVGVSGAGTLTAIDEGGGTFFITGGIGTVSDATFGDFAVTFAACTFGSICTLTNTDGNFANITYDNIVAPLNAIGSQLTAFGVALLPGPPGSNTTAINLYDSPSQLFYSFANDDPNGFQDLSTAFNVTTAAVPGPTVGDGAASFALAALFLGWLVRRRTVSI